MAALTKTYQHGFKFTQAVLSLFHTPTFKYIYSFDCGTKCKIYITESKQFASMNPLLDAEREHVTKGYIELKTVNKTKNPKQTHTLCHWDRQNLSRHKLPLG